MLASCSLLAIAALQLTSGLAVAQEDLRSASVAARQPLSLFKAAQLGKDEVVIVNSVEGTLAGRSAFGVPPVKDLRWKAPQPPTSWSNVRDASVYGDDCASDKSDYVEWPTSEDCLYLNVFRPNATQGSGPLPVMVFVFGGSWEIGGDTFILYDGGQLAKHGQAIIVTINYRLLTFGFLASPELKAEDPNGSTGNYGLQDQRAALVWVQRNIKAFGGDPNNVMLFGQSAGAGSTTSHAVMPRSNGLFSKIGLESGPPADWSSLTLDYAYAHADKIASSLNCSGQQGADWLSCMRSKSVEDIVANLNNDPNRVIDWAPTIDGSEITEEPQLLWEKGAFNDFDSVLLGVVRDEGTEFLSKIKSDATAADYDSWFDLRFISPFKETVKALYPADVMDTPFLSASKIVTDALMACPARRAARHATENNRTAFLYRFMHRVLAIEVFEPSWYIGHSSEVPLVFMDYEVLLGPGEPELATNLGTYWTNFAATSNPNKAGVNNPNSQPVPLTWPLYNTTTSPYIRFNTTITTETGFIGDQFCNFWDRVHAAGCHVEAWPLSCNVTALV